MAGRHRSRNKSIQIIRTATVSSKDVKRASTTQYFDSKESGTKVRVRACSSLPVYTFRVLRISVLQSDVNAKKVYDCSFSLSIDAFLCFLHSTPCVFKT